MKLRVMSLMLALSAGNAVADEMLYRTCVSASGNSIYDMELNVSRGQGEVRYRYFGQDIFYKLTITSTDSDVLKGVAEFQSSRSGETKGNPWIFEYDPSANVLMDNGDKRQCK